MFLSMSFFLFLSCALSQPWLRGINHLISYELFSYFKALSLLLLVTTFFRGKIQNFALDEM